MEELFHADNRQDNKEITPEEAEALLLLNNRTNKNKYRKTMYIIWTVTIALCISIALLHVTGIKPKNSQVKSNSSTTLTNNPLNNNGSVDSQVKYCSNPVNANLVC